MTRWVVPCVWLFVACGEGPKPPPKYTGRTEAQSQCDALTASWCQSALDCVQAGLEPENRLSDEDYEQQLSLCVDGAKRTCDEVDALGEGYDACLASVEALDAADCEAIRTAESEGEDTVPMPAACEDVLLGI